jgi:pteridine reductase
MAQQELPLAVVSGAAHRLGRIFALRLAKMGYAILLHYFNAEEDALATAEDIRACGVPATLSRADLRTETAIGELMEQVDRLPNPLKLLVNSAGVMPHQRLQTTSSVDWDATLDLNLRAPFLLGQAAASRMKSGGLIVNVTDASATRGWTGYAAYSVSKSGLETLTRIQAKAYAPHIRVNALAPGLVLPSPDTSSEDWDQLVARSLLKKAVDPEDLAGALEFLVRNGSVTGQVIVVDAGFSLAAPQG